MLLPNQNGILCDICKTTYSEDFKYYSYDFRKVIVTNNSMPVLKYTGAVDMSSDLCEGCNEKFKTLIIKNHKPTKIIPTRVYPEGIYCEFTSKKLIGTYTFYHGTITEVTVKLSHKKYNCTSCNIAVMDHTKPCPQCKQSKFLKSADLVTRDRVFEIWICDTAYESLRKTTKHDIQKERALWSSSAE